MYDEADSSNRPIPALHGNAIALWNCFPEYIKSAFKQSFSKPSLLQMQGRLLEQQWFHLLISLKSSIVKCLHSIFEGVKMYDYHIKDNQNFSSVAGELLAKPGKLGLKNVSNIAWTVTNTKDEQSTKQPKEVIVLGIGTKIDFGNDICATVVAN